MERFQKMEKKSKTSKEEAKIFGERTKRLPKKVAIPRPPANLIKRDQLWPKMAATPQRAWRETGKPEILAKKTARDPLPISPKTVAKAGKKPTFRKTLEPEVFRQPISKIFFPAILEKM